MHLELSRRIVFRVLRFVSDLLKELDRSIPGNEHGDETEGLVGGFKVSRSDSDMYYAHTLDTRCSYK